MSSGQGSESVSSCTPAMTAGAAASAWASVPAATAPPVAVAAAAALDVFRNERRSMTSTSLASAVEASIKAQWPRHDNGGGGSLAVGQEVVDRVEEGLRPDVPGLSENIRVFSVVGRFLEHSRIFRFTNGGEPEYYIGSADWMRRNLNSRVETVLPILDGELQKELDGILRVYDADNCSVWECAPDGTYRRRTPGDGQERRAAQDVFLAAARNELPIGEPPETDGDADVWDGTAPFSSRVLMTRSKSSA